MGYVPQEQILFSKTVRENIQFGLVNASDDKILEAISTAAFSSDLDTLESGLDTLVGERGVSLSGGQKQRVSLSRALSPSPKSCFSTMRCRRWTPGPKRGLSITSGLREPARRL